MESRLGESRAIIIRNAIRNDPTFFMSDEWLEEHNVDKEECLAFLDYAVEHAKMADFQAENTDIGAVDVKLTFTTHSGKVGQTDEKWTCFAPQADTKRILSVAEQGAVIATLVPEQMAVQTRFVDAETGEIL